MGDLIADIYHRRMTHTERIKEFASENKLVVTVFLSLLLIIAVTFFHSLLMFSPKNGQSNEGYVNPGGNKLMNLSEDNIIKVKHGIFKVPPKPTISNRAQDHPGLYSPIQ